MVRPKPILPACKKYQICHVRASYSRMCFRPRSHAIEISQKKRHYLILERWEACPTGIGESKEHLQDEIMPLLSGCIHHVPTRCTEGSITGRQFQDTCSFTIRVWRENESKASRYRRAASQIFERVTHQSCWASMNESW